MTDDAEPASTDDTVRRLRLTIAYDGQPWRGWQSMPHGHTIQDQIETAFAKVASIHVRIHGSGRTDSGVHALAQVAHVDVPVALPLDEATWVRALNAVLPSSIRILDCQMAHPRFHARFDATGKRYRYRIWRPRILMPLEACRAAHVWGPLDLDAIRTGLSLIQGTHNFVRLSANRGAIPDTERRKDIPGSTRTIHHAECHEHGDTLELEFEGTGFLYKMVRILTGTLIHIGRGRASLNWLTDLLRSPEGDQSRHVAPAGGLYLVQVHYPTPEHKTPYEPECSIQPPDLPL